MSKIQAILFDRDKYSKTDIFRFLKKHEFYPIKGIHTTNNYYRLRLKNPRKDKQYRTKTITNGIKFIIEY